MKPIRPSVSALRSLCLRGLVVLGLLGAPSLVSAKEHLKIAASTQAIDAFTNWTAAGSWESINNYKNLNAIRPVIDMVLQLQALKAGGLDFDFELVPVPDYERAKQEVIQGRAMLCGETIWDNEIAENAARLRKTEPIIRNGEFVKGIYVLPTNEKLLKVSSLEALRAYVGAVVATWALDLATLEKMQLKGIEKGGHLDTVFLAIQKQKADFTLAEFSLKPDMSTENRGVKLIPVPNCKIAIDGSRSWIVQKDAPASAKVFEALNAGVKILREQGTIERAFRESGFFNQRVADWKRLN